MRPEAVPIHLGSEEHSVPEFVRADSQAICASCGKTYQRHQLYSWGPFPLYLYKTCDGRFWKL